MEYIVSITPSGVYRHDDTCPRHKAFVKDSTTYTMIWKPHSYTWVWGLRRSPCCCPKRRRQRHICNNNFCIPSWQDIRGTMRWKHGFLAPTTSADCVVKCCCSTGCWENTLLLRNITCSWIKHWNGFVSKYCTQESYVWSSPFWDIHLFAEHVGHPTLQPAPLIAEKTAGCWPASSL